MVRGRQAILLAIVLLYAAVFRAVALNRPFAYDAEGSGCLNGVLARNYLRFPWSDTHGMPVLTPGLPGSAPLVFYPDHPPMVPLLIVPFYAAFGIGAWQTRLPIAATTLLAIYLLFRLVGRSASPRAGVAAAAVFAATPMTLYFGGFPDVVGMPLVCLVLLVIAAYLRFHRAAGPVTFGWLVGAFVLAGACDWPAYVVVPVLSAHFVATRPRTEWRWAAAFAAAACAVFVAMYAYITLATHSEWTWMAPLFSRRSGIVGRNAFTAGEWLSAAARTNRTYHTLPLLVAAGAWMSTALFRRPRLAGPPLVVSLLFGWAALYAAIGSKALFNHEWAWLPFTPAIAAAAGLLVDQVLGAAERSRFRGAVRVAVAVAVAAFMASTAAASFRLLYPDERGELETPVRMGAAIRAAAPDANDTALVFGGEAPAQWWFYGDRPLRTNIWTTSDVDRRLNDATADVMFDFDQQPWDGRATGLVLPAAWASEFRDFHREVSRRYPRIALPPALAGRFEVFDLRRAPTVDPPRQ